MLFWISKKTSLGEEKNHEKIIYKREIDTLSKSRIFFCFFASYWNLHVKRKSCRKEHLEMWEILIINDQLYLRKWFVLCNFEKFAFKRAILFRIDSQLFVAKAYVAVFRIKGSSLCNDFIRESMLNNWYFLSTLMLVWYLYKILNLYFYLEYHWTFFALLKFLSSWVVK